MATYSHNNNENTTSFNQLSIVGQFHTAPKRFGEKAEYPFDIQDSDIREIRMQTFEKVNKLIDKKEKLTSSDGLHFYNIIKKVMGISLMPEAENDPEEIKKLNLCKEKIKKYVRNVLNDIQKYIQTILEGDEAARTKNPKVTEQSEARRKTAHNRLMSDINTLNRSLVWWFGKNKINPENLPSDLRRMYEKQEDTYISDNIERVDIGANGIYPRTLNINDRTQVTYWALRIYKDLAKLENHLSLS